MKVKEDFLRFGSFVIRDGSQLRFWEDKWLGQNPLKDQYPGLYSIARHKFCTIVVVLGSNPPNISWRRNLLGHNLVAWNDLLPQIANIQLAENRDISLWNLHQNGQFSVKSLYLALIQNNSPNVNSRLWKNRALLKLKIFYGTSVGG